MKDFRYLPSVASLRLDEMLCVGCGMCTVVCPHGVFEQNEGKARVVDLDGCMECGGCATNCPVGAIAVSPGVGCASYIINVWLKGREEADRIGCC